MLNHSPAEIVRKLLVALGVGTLPSSNGAWPIYATQESDTPDNAVFVNDRQGNIQGRIHYTGDTREAFGLTIKVRGKTHSVTWGKFKEVSLAIDQQINRDAVVLDATTYTVCAVTRTAGITVNGKEPTSNRRLITIEAVVTIEY